jgi:hypothetical protein
MLHDLRHNRCDVLTHPLEKIIGHTHIYMLRETSFVPRMPRAALISDPLASFPRTIQYGVGCIFCRGAGILPAI